MRVCMCVQELKNVVLINCGATEDVRELCQLPETVRIIIIDSHRPVWHGHNDNEDDKTLVLLDQDDPVKKEVMPVYDREFEDAAAGAARIEQPAHAVGPACHAARGLTATRMLCTTWLPTSQQRVH